MISMIPERLETPRLLLTRPVPDDFPDLHAMHTNEQVMATLGGLRTPEQLVALHQRIVDAWTNVGFGWWILRFKDDHRFVGRGGTSTSDDRGP